MSNFDKVEQAYNQLKTPIYELLSQPDTTDQDKIIKQNSKMLKYFTQLNKIVSLLSDTKIPPIKKKPNLNTFNINNNNINNEKIEEKIEENNEKILNNYKKENNKMEKLLKK